MIRNLRTLEDAESILDYFNGFHDGFIKQLVLKSQDEFKDWGHQLCTGDLSLEITFAHYNYAAGTRPHTQIIEARFDKVKNLSIKFSGKSHEWSIINVFITKDTRTRVDGSIEPCFRAVLLQNRLGEDQEWRTNEDLVFTFSEATFLETK